MCINFLGGTKDSCHFPLEKQVTSQRIIYQKSHLQNITCKYMCIPVCVKEIACNSLPVILMQVQFLLQVVFWRDTKRGLSVCFGDGRTDRLFPCTRLIRHWLHFQFFVSLNISSQESLLNTCNYLIKKEQCISGFSGCKFGVFMPIFFRGQRFSTSISYNSFLLGDFSMCI